MNAIENQLMDPKVIPLKEYADVFVQRVPRYAIKPINGGHWYTKQRPLIDPAVLGHLEGKYYVGSLARWYPSFCVIDIDDREKNEAMDIRATLGLDNTNSFLQASESVNSYHILFKPQLNGKPPTIKRLQSAMKGFAKENHIEVYPQPRRVIRLPFGLNQSLLDETLSHLTSWSEKFYWFQKLNPFDLGGIEGVQPEIPLSVEPIVRKQCEHQMFSTHWNEEAEYLLTHGLQSPSTREQAQFVILYHFFRANMAQDIAEKDTWDWIRQKHNGYSEEIIKYPSEVRKHIHRQAAHIYENYDRACCYPDSTHNQHNGYICKPDIEDIIRIAGGNMPRSKFLFNLVKHSYPRRHRSFIGIHSDKLIAWASEWTYQKYLDELESKGIVKRGSAYSTGAFSKNLKLYWKYRSSNEAILYSGRSLDTLESTLALIYKPGELGELLRSAGAERTASLKIVNRIYDEV